VLVAIATNLISIIGFLIDTIELEVKPVGNERGRISWQQRYA